MAVGPWLQVAPGASAVILARAHARPRTPPQRRARSAPEAHALDPADDEVLAAVAGDGDLARRALGGDVALDP
jgi:hypothetical protein